MLVKSLGAVVTTECELKLDGCTAVAPGPVVVVKEVFTGLQHNVCRNCLEEMIRSGDWEMQNTSIQFRSDFAVISAATNKAVIALEIKAHSWVNGHSEGSRARRWYWNQMMHGRSLPTRYLMLFVLSGHLWIFDVGSSKDAENYNEIAAIPAAEALRDLNMRIDETAAEPVLSDQFGDLLQNLLNSSAGKNAPGWIRKLRLGEVLPERMQIVSNFTAA
ncbi:MAG TPA: hypothetical protein VGL56_13430 [Fimbriimonadaceae bacterium]|jgi:hypothetical protein